MLHAIRKALFGEGDRRSEDSVQTENCMVWFWKNIIDWVSPIDEVSFWMKDFMGR